VSHFYNPITGELVDGLREARKFNALPSPTTVKAAGAGLIEYFKNQYAEAGFGCGCAVGEATVTYSEKKAEIYLAAKLHSEKAAMFGTALHNLCNDHIQGKEVVIPSDPLLSGAFNSFAKWYDVNVEEALITEQVVKSDSYGYAGRVDLIALMKDKKIKVVDFKSQGTKPKNKVNFYRDWARQLASYAMAETYLLAGEWMPMPKVDGIISLAISSTEDGRIEAQEWTGMDTHHAMFINQVELWRDENNYPYVKGTK
jgi:hypothetical protein